MFELLIIPTLLGLGLAVDFMASDDDTPEAAPIEVNLADDVAHFNGTDAREHVTGNDLDNIFVTEGGEDLLSGQGGNDTLDSGDDNDRIFGGAGDDVALGGDGDDRIFLSDGDDTTLPSVDAAQDGGDDLIRGGAGDDLIVDTFGSNNIFGDIHHDTILTVDGLDADGTYDYATADGTPDTVHGGYGNDTIAGDDGDILTGGEGDDRFVIATASTQEGAPVVVTDFDLRDDLLSVVFLEAAPQDPTVRFTFDATANALSAQVEGKEVATLSGLTLADVPFLNTFVTTLPELLTDTA